MGFKDWFRGRKKAGKPGARPAPAPQEKADRLNALVAIGCSIKNYSFRAARPFLAARHGTNTFISPRVLYYEADQLFLTARKLAKEIGDKKKEAEILFHWAQLQHRPPSKGVRLATPKSVDELVDLVRSKKSGDPEGGESPGEAPVQSMPELALPFFLEAIPLAEQTGHDVVAAASLLYTAQIYQGRGDTANYRAQMEELHRKMMRIVEAKTPLPQWLLDEIREQEGVGL